MVPYQSQPGGIKEWETAESVQTILQFLRDNRFLGLNTGGVAALNHRLMFQLLRSVLRRFFQTHKAGRSPSPVVAGYKLDRFLVVNIVLPGQAWQ